MKIGGIKIEPSQNDSSYHAGSRSSSGSNRVKTAPKGRAKLNVIHDVANMTIL